MPVLVSFIGIFVCFVVIAALVTLSQRKDNLDDYHKVNLAFTHNIAANYTETVLQEDEFILDRAASYFAHNDRLNTMVNSGAEEGLQTLMQILSLMPSVSSISLADPQIGRAHV